jgi:hypothetical protein
MLNAAAWMLYALTRSSAKGIATAATRCIVRGKSGAAGKLSVRLYLDIAYPQMPYPDVFASRPA